MNFAGTGVCLSGYFETFHTTYSGNNIKNYTISKKLRSKKLNNNGTNKYVLNRKKGQIKDLLDQRIHDVEVDKIGIGEWKVLQGNDYAELTKRKVKLYKKGNNWYCSKCSTSVSSKSSGYRHFKICQNKSSKYFGSTANEDDFLKKDIKETKIYHSSRNELKSIYVETFEKCKEVQNSYTVENVLTECTYKEIGILTQKNHDVENLVFDDRKTQEIHNSTKTRAKLIQHGNNRHCTKCSISVSSKSPGYRHFKVCQGIDINGKNDSSKYFAEPEKKVDKKTKECEKVCSSEKELKSMNYEEEANEVQNSFPAQKSSQVLENISPVSTEELLTKISFKGSAKCEHDEKKILSSKGSKKIIIKSPFFKNNRLIPEGSRGAHQHISYDPPKSPFNLIQEKLHTNPWKLLIATIFLNVTTSRVAFPILENFFEMYDNPKKVLGADWRGIAELMKPMGIHEKRARYIIRFSNEYLHKDWHEASDLFGIGKYGNDSYRIFCLGQWKHVVPEDHKLNLYHEWITEQYRLGFVR